MTADSSSAPSPSTDSAEPEWKEAFRKCIVKMGMRVTEQRMIIADEFFGLEGHANVEEIYDKVRARKSSIGYATVYRTVKLLADCGLAETHNFRDGSTRFEPAIGDDHHDHLICTECGHIVEFENDEIEKLQLTVAESLGFELTDHRMELYGICREKREGKVCPHESAS